MGLRGRKPKNWEDLIERLPEAGCWIWLGMLDGGWGYGRIEYCGRKWQAHHHVWLQHGFPEIPKGMILMHSCDIPCCVNPAHLRIGTHRDNLLDSIAKGRRHYQKSRTGWLTIQT